MAGIDGTAIDQVLRDAVESGGVPHVAAIAADRDGVIYQGSAGPRAAGESDPVTVDTLFRIMSMTKMPCTVAALQQVEQGNLDLDAPVAQYCPEFADVQVLTGFDGETPQLRAPASQATVRNLITHTTGLGYWFWSEDLVRWEAATGMPDVVAGSSANFTAPMLADPGQAFIYGINIDWLGKVVEAVTGVGLDVAIKEGITGPLGMDHTTFLMNDEQRPRLDAGARQGRGRHLGGDRRGAEPVAGVLGRRPRAVRAAQRLHQVRAGAAARRRARTAPGSCSSPRPWTRRSPTRSATWTSRPTSRPPTRCRAATSAPGPGYKWGYGLLLNTADIPGMRRAWSGAWAGLCNTHFWVDRSSRHLRVDLQQLPAVRDARGRHDVQRLRARAVRLTVTRPRPAR